MFPLPLTPFEYYYWADDRPDYPTAFAFDLDFSGVPQRARLEEALQVVLPRHPLLQSHVVPEHRGGPAWVPAPHDTPPIFWSQSPPTKTPDWYAAQRIDLTQNVGLRAWVIERDGTSQIRILFHHACCDALGAMGFVEDWFAAYHSLITGQPMTDLLPPLELERLKARGDFSLAASDRRSRLAETWRMLQLWAWLLGREPMVLEPPGKRPVQQLGQSPSPPDVLAGTLDAEHTRKLRHIATAVQAKVNDLMLRDLFLALNQWNAAHGHGHGRPWRITMPTALRGKLDRQMPATNLLGYSFLSRHPRDLRDPHRLLHRIRSETTDIKRSRLGLSFLHGLKVATHIPGFVRWRLHRDRSFSSAVFSNLGRVGVRSRLRRRDGRLFSADLVLDRIVGAPPVRPGTRASFATYHYGDETVLTLRCDPQWFTREHAETMLQIFLDRLRQTVREGK